MPANKRRFFLCTGQCVVNDDLYKYPNSHIIGELCYLTDEGRKVSALARYEVSVSTAAVPPIKPEIDVYLIGDARRIKCRFPKKCKRSERWEIGKKAFLQLVQRYGYGGRGDNNDVVKCNGGGDANIA